MSNEIEQVKHFKDPERVVQILWNVGMSIAIFVFVATTVIYFLTQR